MKERFFHSFMFLIRWSCRKDKPKQKGCKIMNKSEKKSLLVGSMSDFDKYMLELEENAKK